MKVAGWRVWYDGGAIYQGGPDRDWSDLPDDGVLVAMIYYCDGSRRLMHVPDYYFSAHHPEGIIYGYAYERPDPKRYHQLSVKRGIWAPDEYFNGILAGVHESTWP